MRVLLTNTTLDGAHYATFLYRVEDLDRLDWVKEAKKAEFLVHDRFPWILIDRIGVFSTAVRVRADKALHHAGHRPRLDVVPNWYY